MSGLDLIGGVDPIRLDFETSDATDDIRVTFSDGRRAYVSAKRKVSKGRPLTETVAGWIGQVPTLGCDDLLVIAGEDFVGPTKDLDRVLRRHRAGLQMVTKDERDAFDPLANLLPEDLREPILDRVRILHLPDSTGAGAARSLLAALMDLVVTGARGHQAVSTLADLFHQQAGKALGSGIDDWVTALNNTDLTVIADRGGPAGMRAAARLAAVGTYRDRLKAEVGRIDLSLLAEDLPPISIDGLVDGLKINLETERSSSDLLPCVRRWRRMLIVGQPGSGKSVALREIAAHCAIHPHAPVPIRVALPRLIAQQPERLTIDGIIDSAVADAVGGDQRVPLTEYLAAELAAGRAIILCDGLDECGTRAPWVAQQLADILNTLPPRVGFVLTTRANAQIAATRLGLPRVELVSPQDLAATIDRVLFACAEARVPQVEREAWLVTRRTWIKDAAEQHEHLLAVPLLAILLTLICAGTSDADLPKGRATLLHRAVEQSVHRWERTRETLEQGRPWLPALTTTMLLDGFIVLGRVLDGGATPTRAQAVDTVEQMLKDTNRWSMPPAQAEELAQQVLRFWDEHVAVFVVNAADELTTRSKVFAEIATAMWASRCGAEELINWLSDALEYTDSDGAIALAAGLDPRTIAALLNVGATGRSEATLLVAELATRGIATVTPHELERILAQLTAGAIASQDSAPPARRGPMHSSNQHPTLWDETRDPGPWPFVEAACLLALPIECRFRRADLIARAALDDRSTMIAAALSALTDATTDNRPLGETAAAAVNSALSIPLPPKSKMVKESRRRSKLVSGGRMAPGLDQVALAAAGRLDELAEGSGELAYQIGMRTRRAAAGPLFAALERAGVDTNRSRSFDSTRFRKWLAAHQENETALLADLGTLDTDLSENDCWSLSDIGDLIAATNYQETGIEDFNRAFSHDSAQVRRSWLGAIADAYGIDKSAMASQARYLQEVKAAGANDDCRDSEWSVAAVSPLVEPPLSDGLHSALTTDQLRTLLSCLEAESDWIAWAAASVLVAVTEPPWDSRELLAKDMSSWHRTRAGLLHMVAILTAGDNRSTLLAQAATSDSPDLRYAARMAISASDLDSDGAVMDTLLRDPDLSIRPQNSRKAPPLPTHWTCQNCRSANDIDVEDCLGCTGGVRPDA
ncbi:NACHT domain-containing protein [Nocardia sp. NPDC050412]|uniref:NACHT domain-containing protein n=1 Tax=Nocardia sp. NPDC050412 TaxID=3364320 RepID=UPI00379D9356